MYVILKLMYIKHFGIQLFVARYEIECSVFFIKVYFLKRMLRMLSFSYCTYTSMKLRNVNDKEPCVCNAALCICIAALCICIAALCMYMYSSSVFMYSSSLYVYIRPVYMISSLYMYSSSVCMYI